MVVRGCEGACGGECSRLIRILSGGSGLNNIDQLSYPVLYSGDDEKYLRTDIYGNSTIAGCNFHGRLEYTGILRTDIRSLQDII